jgi:hypothetical protein
MSGRAKKFPTGEISSDAEQAFQRRGPANADVLGIAGVVQAAH